MSVHPKKIIFAAGGTGGHLFAAHALAAQLLKEMPDLDLLFAGARLSANPYFEKEKFPFEDIASATPFAGGAIKAMASLKTLYKGVRQSMRLLKEHQPALVVGFGSFHAFPVLCAAVLKRVPLILFESNIVPGKVVRLFAKRAHLTALHFPQAFAGVKGKTAEVSIPMKSAHTDNVISKESALRQLNLDPQRFTLLVFGGSQGAKAINEHLLAALPLLCACNLPLQLIHFTGDEEMRLKIDLQCSLLGIPCYVKVFEKQIEIPWSAADLVLCRSGALTLSEMIHYAVPGILVPYPFAADQHQLKNALFLEKDVGGAIHIPEDSLTPERLREVLQQLAIEGSLQRANMKRALKDFKDQQKKEDLGRLILEFLQNTKTS